MVDEMKRAIGQGQSWFVPLPGGRGKDERFMSVRPGRSRRTGKVTKVTVTLKTTRREGGSLPE